VRDGSASIYEILETIQTITIGVYVDYAKGWAQKKKDDAFKTNLNLFLMRDCDQIIKETQGECEQTNEEKIDYCGKLSIKRDDKLLERVIGETIWIIDTEANKIDYLVSKFRDN